MKAPMSCTQPLPQGRGSDPSRDREGAVSFSAAGSSTSLPYFFLSGGPPTAASEAPQSPLSPLSEVLTPSFEFSASGLRASASPRLRVKFTLSILCVSALKRLPVSALKNTPASRGLQ